MYSEAIDYHIYAVLLLVLTITLFYIYTQFQQDFGRYKKSIRIWMPIYGFALASTFFTGVVMMAAKHLEFTLANNLMIAETFLLLYLEIRRHKMMKVSPQSDEAYYIAYAKRIYAIELLTVFVVVYIAKSAAMV